MTCIAWDGKTLAADKRCCAGSAKRTVTKIHRLPNGNLVGVAGDFAVGQAMIAWLKAGSILADFPEKQKSRDSYASILEIRKDGTAWKYEDTAFPFQYEDAFCAIGSGRDFALASMWYGAKAEEAVRVASALSPDCGDGIDILELEC